MHLKFTKYAKLNYLLNNQLFQHILYWVVIVLFFSVFWGSDSNEYVKTLYSELIQLPAKFIAVYSIIYVLLPIFLFKKKYSPFILSSLLIILGAGILQNIIFSVILNPLVWGNYYHEMFNVYEIMHRILDINTVLMIPIVARTLKFWYTKQQEAQILAQEKLEAELKFLKTQIHPHFLFNSLNNLYALILKKSDVAGDVVLKLADLMRYMLYESNAPKVFLDQEIKYIDNYITLEKVRFGERIRIEFAITGDTQGLEIAPMLILPFVENSFKHSAQQISGSWIEIVLHIEQDTLHLTVSNNKSDIKKSKETDFASGIGLQNVKRRLELIYKGEYTLDITDKEDTYIVKLTLNLT